MKKYLWIIVGLSVLGCSNGGSSSSNSSLEKISSQLVPSQPSSSSGYSSTSHSSMPLSEEKDSSYSISLDSSLIEENDKLPGNAKNKVTLGNDNASMTSFSFINELPEYFRYIYGYKYLDKADRYANGEVKISSSNQAKQGFQTAMFVSNLKLEIRLQIGQMNSCSAGNKIDKNKPVLTVDGFDETGKYIRSVEIDEINKNNENKDLRFYMDGSNLAYLEFRFTQLPYKGSQAYNIGLKGLSMIAWPYPLD